jgi:hypothetical protein
MRLLSIPSDDESRLVEASWARGSWYKLQFPYPLSTQWGRLNSINRMFRSSFLSPDGRRLRKSLQQSMNSMKSLSEQKIVVKTLKFRAFTMFVGRFYASTKIFLSFVGFMQENHQITSTFYHVFEAKTGLRHSSSCKVIFYRKNPTKSHTFGAWRCN